MNVKQRRSAAAKKSWRSRKRMQGAQRHVETVAKATTKSDRIRAYLAEGKAVCEIAEIEKCNKAYVRVVRRRLEQPFRESSHFAWRAKNLDAYRAYQREWRRKRQEARA